MPFHPIGCFVTIRPQKPEPKIGSIFVPDSVHESKSEVAKRDRYVYDRGTVAATGKGEIHRNGKLEKHVVKPGDFVLFEKTGPVMGADIVDEDGEKLLVMHACNIIAVVEQ